MKISRPHRVIPQNGRVLPHPTLRKGKQVIYIHGNCPRRHYIQDTWVLIIIEDNICWTFPEGQYLAMHINTRFIRYKSHYYYILNCMCQLAMLSLIIRLLSTAISDMDWVLYRVLEHI